MLYLEEGETLFGPFVTGSDVGPGLRAASAALSHKREMSSRQLQGTHGEFIKNLDSGTTEEGRMQGDTTRWVHTGVEVRGGTKRGVEGGGEVGVNDNKSVDTEEESMRKDEKGEGR